ncbi:MAG: DUF4383 domain-containing protein [Solirubrobacterales bacterium]
MWRELLRAERPLAPAQWAAILGSLAVLVWSVPGLIINPDFSTGDAATSEVVLGVDMNGWHALSGFPVALPGLFAALRPSWAAPFDVAAAAALVATGVWALLDAHAAAGLFYFPNSSGDAILHFATASIFAAGALHHYVLAPRRTPPA